MAHFPLGNRQSSICSLIVIFMTVSHILVFTRYTRYMLMNGVIREDFINCTQSGGKYFFVIFEDKSSFLMKYH